MTTRFELKAYDVIRSPLMTEKSNAQVKNKYTFLVKLNATRDEIKRSVEKLFEVKVQSVNTLIRKGKSRVFRGQSAVLSDTKRAIVTLEPEHKIDYTTRIV